MLSNRRTVAQRLADWVVTIRYADLPPEVISAAKRLVTDNLGLQLKGSILPNVRPQRAFVERLAATPEALIVNSHKRTAVSLAAYVNATCGGSMEFDDCHMLAWHTGSILVSTAMAVGELTGASGRDVLVAITVGHQVMSVLGSIFGNQLMLEGWHGPKVMGGFAAAAATAWLMNVDAMRLANAFAIAGSDSSGPMEYDQSGGEVKRQHSGLAARAGIEAVQLAVFGLTGPLTIFEGARGLFRIFGRVHEAQDIMSIVPKWHIVDTFYRFNPGVATVLPPLDAVASLQLEHQFGWREVKSICVGLPGFSVQHGGHIVRPTDGISAHFSLAFALALRLVTGRSAPEDYLDPRRWSDPDIISLAERIKPKAVEFPPGTPLLAANVEVELMAGTRLVKEQIGFHGHPTIPANAADIEAKFTANVSGILSDPDRDELLGIIAHLDTQHDLARLRHLLSNSSADAG